MRALAICLGIVILLTAACSGGSSSKSGTNANGRDPKSGLCVAGCTGSDAYDTCAIAACDAQGQAAFGSGYQSGSYSGPCGNVYMTCVLACRCDGSVAATNCQSACYTNALADTACATALLALFTCVENAGCVQPVCPTITGTSTSTSTDTSTLTPNCTKAVNCCTTLTATAEGAAYQGTCAQVAAFNDAECVQFLSTVQQYNLCN